AASSSCARCLTSSAEGAAVCWVGGVAVWAAMLDWSIPIAPTDSSAAVRDRLHGEVFNVLERHRVMFIGPEDDLSSGYVAGNFKAADSRSGCSLSVGTSRCKSFEALRCCFRRGDKDGQPESSLPDKFAPVTARGPSDVARWRVRRT